MRLLIVDDNAELAEALAAAFLRRDIRCDITGTARDAEHLIGTTDYAAVVLDLGLPDEDGLVLLRRLRARHFTLPVIVLSARSAGEMRVLGLESGADDYLVKPFLFVELHARLVAILRRQGGYIEDVLRAADLTLDTRSREVRAGNAPLSLSVREVELLELLMRRAGHVVPKRVLADQLFGASDALGSNAVDVYVHRVRRKLEDCAAVKVQTVRGIGYMLSSA